MARPKNEQTGEFITLSIRIPKELHNDLKQISISEERSLNWVISRILRLGLNRSLIEKNDAGNNQTTL